MEQKCANCGNGKWRDGVTAITSTCTECRYVDKEGHPQPSNWIPKVQTNADRIRAMSDEELKYIAKAVITSQDCPMGETECIDCVFHDLCLRGEYYYNNEAEWLKQHVEDQ